jgi:hypothetical protein
MASNEMFTGWRDMVSAAASDCVKTYITLAGNALAIAETPVIPEKDKAEILRHIKQAGKEVYRAASRLIKLCDGDLEVLKALLTAKGE